MIQTVRGENALDAGQRFQLFPAGTFDGPLSQVPVPNVPSVRNAALDAEATAPIGRGANFYTEFSEVSGSSILAFVLGVDHALLTQLSLAQYNPAYGTTWVIVGLRATEQPPRADELSRPRYWWFEIPASTHEGDDPWIGGTTPLGQAGPHLNQVVFTKATVRWSRAIGFDARFLGRPIEFTVDWLLPDQQGGPHLAMTNEPRIVTGGFAHA